MKAQVNQVFVYMIAAIIFAIVLLFGYKSVSDLNERSEYIALIDLKTELESAINGIAPTQDKSIREFRVPGDYNEICFVDMTLGGEDRCTQPNNQCYRLCYINQHSNPDKLPGIICNAWESNVTQSVFFMPMAGVSIKTARIEVRDEDGNNVGARCIPIQRGRVKLQLTGKGDRTVIQ